jgi:hypothetical protein
MLQSYKNIVGYAVQTCNPTDRKKAKRLPDRNPRKISFGETVRIMAAYDYQNTEKREHE